MLIQGVFFGTIITTDKKSVLFLVNMLEKRKYLWYNINVIYTYYIMHKHVMYSLCKYYIVMNLCVYRFILEVRICILNKEVMK